jgi:hypothetical protein
MSTRSPEEAPRPRQVTLAGSLVMAASAMLVASVFERLGNLRSVESRSAIERFLSQPPGSDLGLGMESVLDILYTVSMVAAGLGTAAAILGFHVLKRNRSARVALSILALPLFLCGLVTGGFLASVVAVSVAMLWLAPSRHWFEETTPTPTTSTGPGVGSTGAWPGPAAPPPPAPYAAPPRVDLPSQPPVVGHLTHGPPPWPPYAAGPQPPARRPTALVVACVVTWVCCALAVLLSVLLMAVLAADADGLFAEMHRQNPDLTDQGVSDATLRSATWVTGGVCLVWSVASSAFAVLAFLRRRWAAIALVVSAGAVALTCLAGSLVSPPLVVPGILAAAAAGLVLHPSVQRWLARREVRGGPRRPRMPGPGMM